MVVRIHYILYAMRLAKVRKNFEDTPNESQLLEIRCSEVALLTLKFPIPA